MLSRSVIIIVVAVLTIATLYASIAFTFCLCGYFLRKRLNCIVLDENIVWIDDSVVPSGKRLYNPCIYEECGKFNVIGRISNLYPLSFPSMNRRVEMFIQGELDINTGQWVSYELYQFKDGHQLHEDIRKASNGILTFSSFPKKGEKKYRQSVLHNGKIINLVHPNNGNNEKNWAHFMDGDQNLFSQSISPHIVYHCDLNSGQCKTISHTTSHILHNYFKSLGLTPRGGSNFCVDPLDNQWVAVGHVVKKIIGKHYYTFVYWIEPNYPYRVTKFTPIFKFKTKKTPMFYYDIQMAIGITPKKDEFVISFGHADNRGCIARVKRSSLPVITCVQ